MNTCKLIFRNVCKNIRDYLIYFLTLTLSVSLFYAFNSISDQPAFSNMGMTGTLLYRQLGIMLSTLSTMIAVVLAFLILYKPDADSNEVLQKMIPIGLDSTHGYRYAEKNMMYETFYGLDALVSFLCCYIGLVFLLICAALLALKQLTETTDNVYRYGLLQKLGAGRRQINHTLFVQTAVFFAIPLVVAGVYSAFLIGKAMAVVEEFMNIHIATNIGLTIVLFLLVYGSYFLATYLSCKRIVTEQRELEV